jgi:hypothetical protein
MVVRQRHLVRRALQAMPPLPEVPELEEINRVLAQVGWVGPEAQSHD